MTVSLSDGARWLNLRFNCFSESGTCSATHGAELADGQITCCTLLPPPYVAGEGIDGP